MTEMSVKPISCSAPAESVAFPPPPGQDDFLLTIGKRRIAALFIAIGFDLELAARDVAGAGDGSALAQLPLLADIDQQHATRIKQALGLFRRQHGNGFTRLVHALAKGLAF